MPQPLFLKVLVLVPKCHHLCIRESYQNLNQKLCVTLEWSRYWKSNMLYGGNVGGKRGRKIETEDFLDVAELRLPASHIIRQVGWNSSTPNQNKNFSVERDFSLSVWPMQKWLAGHHRWRPRSFQQQRVQYHLQLEKEVEMAEDRQSHHYRIKEGWEWMMVHVRRMLGWYISWTIKVKLTLL